MSIGSDVVEPVNVVHNLGVLFDKNLNMKSHISNISWTCFFRSVRQQLCCDVTERLVSAFVLSRLDFCKAVLAGLPDATLSSGLHVNQWTGSSISAKEADVCFWSSQASILAFCSDRNLVIPRTNWKWGKGLETICPRTSSVLINCNFQNEA